ncbi:MAG TPA: 3-methyl-2-oxobutanoate hydroxymethyltransferase [Ktedonobacteraceae bacterium]|jgi:3-methyl-2-oxobutanoate hydroxymethyltransferase|nr:3-methyl-2-oxobutanoate hydroxymethyltransferase [Ktedonobacteraceae bacterium]
MRDKVTVPAILARKGGPKLKVVTAYDTPSAQVADQAGADIILVGDTLAHVVLGFEDTLPATVDIMVHHTAAVARAKPNALVLGDLPWLSFHISVEETVRNAGRLMREGRAEAVKLEGGRKRLPMVEALLAAEIPVMGHLGLTPQSIHTMGGYRVQGRGVEAARELVEDARALAAAGVFAIVLEGVPDVVAQIVTQEVPVPTIGIGAGPSCDGQVLVYHDVLGLHYGRLPKFVRQYAHLADIATEALERFFVDIESGTFPADNESYHMDEASARAFHALMRKEE